MSRDAGRVNQDASRVSPSAGLTGPGEQGSCDLAALTAVVGRWRRHPDRTGLFLDIDGVLAPMAPTPDEAVVPPETVALVDRLSRIYLVILLSGRDMAAMRAMIEAPKAIYSGNHGIEWRQGDEYWVEEEALRRQDTLKDFFERKQSLLAREGLFVEDKGFSFAVHFRLADPETARSVEDELPPSAEAAGLSVKQGRKMVEVRCTGALTKGIAAVKVAGRFNLTKALTIGDDLTDVDAFVALKDTLDQAVGVAVDSPEAPPELLRRADFILESPAQVIDVLRALEDGS